MRKPISMAYVEAVAARYGIKPAPPDHPIYSEGSSIMFISARPRTKNPAGNTLNLHQFDKLNGEKK